MQELKFPEKHPIQERNSQIIERGELFEKY